VPNPARPQPAGTGSAAVPAVQHLVVRYAKRGKMRFASHRDVARAFERGVRRAGLPIAYSAGFTPHPKISYPGGAPTGVASEAEYLSLALTARQDGVQVCQRLNAALPDGIDVIDVAEDAGGGGKPSGSGSSGGTSSSGFAHLEASEWRMVLPGVAPEEARRAVAGFLARAEAPVERRRDKDVRRVDARAAVVEMTVLEKAELDQAMLGTDVAETGSESCAILRMVVLHTAPAVRPEDIVAVLREQDGIAPSSPPMITRLAQGQRAQLTGQALLAGKGAS